MSRTTIRMRVLPRFPVRISGTNGIKGVRDGADLILKNDFSDLVRIPGVENQAKTFFLSWNADLNLYSILSFSDLFSAVPGVTGFMTTAVYDPQGRGTDIFAALDQLNSDLAWEQIGGTVNVAGATQVAWTDLSAYRQLRITGHLFPAASAVLGMQISTDNGATWIASADYYSLSSINFATSNIVATINLGYFPFLNTAVGAGINYGLQMQPISLEEFNKPNPTRFFSIAGGLDAVNELSGMVKGRIAGANANVANNALRIFAVGSTLSGYATLEGIRA